MGQAKFVIFLVYRPGSVTPKQALYNELISVLEELALIPIPLLVGGDFNVHVQDSDDLNSKRLSEIF